MRTAILIVAAMMLVSAIPAAAGTLADVSSQNTKMDGRGLVYALQGSLTDPSGLAPLEIATRFLEENWVLFSKNREDVSNLKHIGTTESITANHVYFQQFFDGYEVMEGKIVVHIRKDGVVQMVHNNLKTISSVISQPAISKELSIAMAQAHVGVLKFVPYLPQDHARLVILADDGGILAWQAFVPALEPLGGWAVYIDASTGKILYEEDVISYIDIPGKVFLTNPVVLSRDPKFVDNVLGIDDGSFTDMYSEVTLKDVDGTLIAAGLLTGPYANIIDKMEVGVSGALNFDYTRDLPQFENVMMYYHVDTSQRNLQSFGIMGRFDKPISVVTRGMVGIQNAGCLHGWMLGLPDPLQEVLLMGWHSITSKTIPTSIPTVGTGGDAVDGFLDMPEDPEVILHEYGHAFLSNGGAGFSSSGSAEAGAIHEGFSDWWSAISLSEYSNGTWDNYLGEWASSYLVAGENETEPPCVRNMISNMTVEQMEGEVHADSFIWSGPSWDIWQEIGRYNATKLMLESMAFLPSTGYFSDAVSAVLQADMNLNNGTHGYFITRTFDRRNITDYTIPQGMSILPPVVETEETQSTEVEKNTPGFETVALLGAIALVSAAFASRRKK